MSVSKLFARAVALAGLLASPSLAQQAMDPTFAEHQKAWTTRPEFSSPLVDHLPASTPGGSRARATCWATTSARRGCSTTTPTS